MKSIWEGSKGAERSSPESSVGDKGTEWGRSQETKPMRACCKGGEWGKLWVRVKNPSNPSAWWDGMGTLTLPSYHSTTSEVCLACLCRRQAGKPYYPLAHAGILSCLLWKLPQPRKTAALFIRFPFSSMCSLYLSTWNTNKYLSSFIDMLTMKTTMCVSLPCCLILDWLRCLQCAINTYWK